MNEITTFFAQENRSIFQNLIMHESFENFKISLREQNFEELNFTIIQNFTKQILNDLKKALKGKEIARASVLKINNASTSLRTGKILSLL